MPHFTDDCEAPCCTYCGSTDATSNAGKIDVYHCTSAGRPHLKIRFGDEGHEYRFSDVESYRKSYHRDPDGWHELGTALEIYDNFINQ
jgi:hypothetical protein